MAGGISNCPDWHTELRERLALCDITLLNPRRANFPIDDPNAAQEQIAWECEHLRAATAISFWFPSQTLCPITLFELGAWSHWQGQIFNAETQEHQLFRKPIFVGAHPDYQRKQDIEIQMKLQRPEIEVVFTLEALARQIAEWVTSIAL